MYLRLHCGRLLLIIARLSTTRRTPSYPSWLWRRTEPTRRTLPMYLKKVMRPQKTLTTALRNHRAEVKAVKFLMSTPKPRPKPQARVRRKRHPLTQALRRRRTPVPSPPNRKQHQVAKAESRWAQANLKQPTPPGRRCHIAKRCPTSSSPRSWSPAPPSSTKPAEPAQMACSAHKRRRSETQKLPLVITSSHRTL